MPSTIYILALATFAVGTQSYVFTGLLSELARDLGVSVGVAGQLATVFAITSGMAAPFVVNFFSRYERRRLLVSALFLVGLINLGTAFLSSFNLFIAARILAALCAILVIPTAGAIAASLVPKNKQGQALGLILSGLTLALILGVPLGTVMGDLFGWRATFVFAGIVALMAMPFVAKLVPISPGTAEASFSNFKVIKLPVVKVSLVLSIISFIAAYPIFAFIGPFIEEVTGLEGAYLGAMQATIGVGSIIGLVLGGKMADGRPFTQNIKILFGAFIGIQVLFSVWFLFPELLGTSQMIAPMALSIIGSSAILFATGPVIEKALVNADPPQAALTLAMNTSMIYTGQGIGAALGGVVIARQGYEAVGGVSAMIAVVAFAIALMFKAKPKRQVKDHKLATP